MFYSQLHNHYLLLNYVPIIQKTSADITHSEKAICQVPLIINVMSVFWINMFVNYGIIIARQILYCKNVHFLIVNGFQGQWT